MKVGAELVPAGVPAESELVAALLPVNAGALLVPAGVPAELELVLALLPVNVGADTVPAGVNVLAPPVSPSASNSV